MSVAGNQQRTLLELLRQLRPHWRKDRNLPGRIQTLLSRNRSFGSRDRRLYRELIYTTLRFLPWVEGLLESQPEHAARLIGWLAADSPVTALFRRTSVTDWPACPSDIKNKAALLTVHRAFLPSETSRRLLPDFHPADLLPSWITHECPEALTESQLDALHRRAPLWLRANADTVDHVITEFGRLGWTWQRSTISPTALQLLDEVDVTKTAAFAQGNFEVQDLGSQLLLASAAIDPAQHWLDACAGAGGKTLQLAQLLGPKGQIDAFDVRRSALAELSVRARRAGLHQVNILDHPSSGEYDGVLVDAPCTGSGTWRRAPHLKWMTGTQQIAAAASTQQSLLARFSARVRQGGRLLYATCSLNRSENEAIVANFLMTHGHFATEPTRHDFGGLVRGGGLTLLPALHNTDGFFIAAFRRHR